MSFRCIHLREKCDYEQEPLYTRRSDTTLIDAGIMFGWVLSHFSVVLLFGTLWAVARQAPLSMEFLRQILEWVAISSSRGSSRPRIQSASLLSPAFAGRFFTTSTSWEAHVYFSPNTSSSYYKSDCQNLGKGCMSQNQVARVII